MLQHDDVEAAKQGMLMVRPCSSGLLVGTDLAGFARTDSYARRRYTKVATGALLVDSRKRSSLANFCTTAVVSEKSHGRHQVVYPLFCRVLCFS